MFSPLLLLVYIYFHNTFALPSSHFSHRIHDKKLKTMSNEKRHNTLLNYSFSSKEVRTDTENSASNSNTSSIPTNTTTTANDDSNLFLASY